MFESERAKLKDWLESQVWEWENSGELCGEFADRVLTHVWWVLEPAVEDRIADEREAAYDRASDMFTED